MPGAALPPATRLAAVAAPAAPFLAQPDLGPVGAAATRLLAQLRTALAPVADPAGGGHPDLRAAQHALAGLGDLARTTALPPMTELCQRLQAHLAAAVDEHAVATSAVLTAALTTLAEQIAAIAAEAPIPVATDLLARLLPTRVGDAVARPARDPARVPVDTDWLDLLLAHARALRITEQRLQQQQARLGLTLGALDATLERLGRHLDQVVAEVPAAATLLGPARQRLSEAAGLAAGSRTRYADCSDLLRGQGEFASALHAHLIAPRLVPFAQLAAALEARVRASAATTGKEVTLQISGGEVPVDGHLLAGCQPLLEQLLQNLVVHGIEAPPVRVAQGKPACATIELALQVSEEALWLRISDDGVDLDQAALQRYAVARGLISPGSTPAAQDLFDLLLQPSFSTAENVTDLPERGAGLELVKAGLVALGGDLRLQPSTAPGVSLLVQLPLALPALEVLLVALGQTRFAVPLGALDALTRGAAQALPPAFAFDHATYPVLPLLATLTATADPPPATARQPVLLVTDGQRRAALPVEQLLGLAQVQVRPLAPPPHGWRALLGTAALADGQLAVLLDIPALLCLAAPVANAPEAEIGAALRGTALALLTPDSIPDSPLAELDEALQQRHHLQLLSAADAADALALAQRHQARLMLLDAQYPGLDVLALVQRVRTDARLCAMPIVLLVSARDEALPRQAWRVGVDRVLAKPISLDQLLAALAPV